MVRTTQSSTCQDTHVRNAILSIENELCSFVQSVNMLDVSVQQSSAISRHNSKGIARTLFLDCSKECQVSDWKNHKVECDYDRKYKFIDEIVYNFFLEYQELIDEKVETARLKSGLGSVELVVDLNFLSESGEVAPALRSPPEFEVLPANIFWNREKDKVSQRYCFQ